MVKINLFFGIQENPFLLFKHKYRTEIHNITITLPRKEAAKTKHNYHTLSNTAQLETYNHKQIQTTEGALGIGTDAAPWG